MFRFDRNVKVTAMNMYIYFDGDDVDEMQKVQLDLYSSLVWQLYHVSADRYLMDVKNTWDFPDFVPVIRNKQSFDHRVLQGAYDLIAAYYRFLFTRREGRPPFPEGFLEKEYYADAWKAYYQQEIQLLSRNDLIAEAIISAVAFENMERGYSAEDRLGQLLRDRYSSMNLLQGK